MFFSHILVNDMQYGFGFLVIEHLVRIEKHCRLQMCNQFRKNMLNLGIPTSFYGFHLLASPESQKILILSNAIAVLQTNVRRQILGQRTGKTCRWTFILHADFIHWIAWYFTYGIVLVRFVLVVQSLHFLPSHIHA